MSEIGREAGTWKSERFNFGGYRSSDWTPDKEFRKEMRTLAKEMGEKLTSTEIEKACLDAYGWYWSDFEEQVAEDPSYLDQLIEWEEPETDRYCYLMNLKK